jgi:hypothetical protein
VEERCANTRGWLLLVRWLIVFAGCDDIVGVQAMRERAKIMGVSVGFRAPTGGGAVCEHGWLVAAGSVVDGVRGVRRHRRSPSAMRERPKIWGVSVGNRAPPG